MDKVSEYWHGQDTMVHIAIPKVIGARPCVSMSVHTLSFYFCATDLCLNISKLFYIVICKLRQETTQNSSLHFFFFRTLIRIQTSVDMYRHAYTSTGRDLLRWGVGLSTFYKDKLRWKSWHSEWDPPSLWGKGDMRGWSYFKKSVVGFISFILTDRYGVTYAMVFVEFWWEKLGTERACLLQIICFTSIFFMSYTYVQ